MIAFGLGAGVVMSKLLKVLAQKSSGVAAKSVFVFGERNSGTNYVNNLIMKNCISRESQGRLYDPQNKVAFGWKHGFPTMKAAPDDVLAIAVVRDPLAWLHSMNRNPWHAPGFMRDLPFSQFIRREWISVIDDEGLGIGRDHPRWKCEYMPDRNPVTGARFGNVMRLRTAKNRAFAGLGNRFGNLLRINYETAMAEPEAFLNALCYSYGLLRLPNFDPVVYDRGTPGRGVFQHKPVPHICETDLQFIRTELNMTDEHAMGYDVTQEAFAMVA
jgi:hypothetical protein